jgi:hypothetical protein
MTDKPYINSTDVNTAVPHVTAQWDGDRLIEITVSRVDSDHAELTQEDFLSAWETAAQLKVDRVEARGLGAHS